MKKLIYLIIAITVLVLIVSGCIPVVPPVEQNEPGALPSKSPGVVLNVTTSVTYGTIQAAITAANPGETISVGDGIYEEAITIGVANLTLQSETNLGATIRPTTTPASWPEAVIYITADGVTVDGFEVDGTTVADNGILGWETSGLTIKNNKIHGATRDWDGCGILLFSWGNGGTVYDNLIENNEVYDTGRMGIMVMDRGANYSVTSGNIITGNTVYDVWKNPQGDQGGGVQINVGMDCAITNNEVHEVRNGQRGIYMFGSATGNIITGNTLTNNEIGIQLWISGEGGTTINWSGETATSPQVHYNNIYGNSSYGAISTNIAGASMVMDATYNWWGHPGGPRRPAGNSDQISGPKAADQVSENVLYHPWLNDEFEWQPTDVGGLVLWLDAGSIQGADGRPIGSWKDSSGQGNHAKQDDSTRQPTYIASAGEELNSQPVVRFDGSNDWMYAPYESTLTEKTMFVVARFNSLGNSSPDSQSRVYVMGLAQINSGWHTTEFKSTYGNWRGRIYDGSGKWVEGSSVVDEQWKLLSLRAVNDEVIEFWEEGTSKGTTAIGTMWTEHNIVAIGANGAPVGFLNGDIAEILIFDRALSNYERQRIERYLNDKYDIY